MDNKHIEFLFHGESTEVLKSLEDNSIDSVVCDPPYGLSKEPDISKVISEWVNGDDSFVPDGKGFMSKEWDGFVPPPSLWKEVYRVLKPGGHALVFAGTRTQDLMTISLRLAGFEVRDVIEWLYFSGFPKSHDVSKAFDRRAGAEREVLGKDPNSIGRTMEREYIVGTSVKRTRNENITAPATELARKWDGWGTSTKPSHEPIIVVSKPKSVEDILDEKLKEVAYCLSLFVKIAVQNSTLSLQDYAEELDSARNRVVPKNSIQDVLSEVTDTSQLKTLTESINWSTALSCLITLGDRLKNGNTSTTETALNTIIELKTLKYFQSLTTLESIIKDATNPDGANLSAETAAELLNDDLLRLSEILTPRVPASATSRQEEKESSHKHEPIIVVRKPLVDAGTGRKLTVADCVEKYGTGAINIDASRITLNGEKAPTGSGKSGDSVYSQVATSNGNGGNTTPEQGRFPANCITLDGDKFYSKYINIATAQQTQTNVTPAELSKKASKKDSNSDWQGEENNVSTNKPQQE